MNKKCFTNSPALMIAMLVLFFTWGFITLANDILIPVLKENFELTYFKAMLIQFSFFLTYFLMALPAAKLVNSTSYKTSIIVGLFILILGCFAFIMASVWHVYLFFLGALFILGTGVVTLQVSANPCVVQLGDKETSCSRLTFSHGFTSLGYAVGPFVLGFFVLADSLKLVYILVALIVFFLSVYIYSSAFNIVESSELQLQTENKRGSFWYPQFIGSIFGLFFFVGAEISAGSLIINYLHLPNVMNMDFAHATKYLSFYWMGSMIGRLVISPLLMIIRPSLMLVTNALVNICLLVGVVTLSGSLAMWSLVLIGLFNSIMFPVIFAIGLNCQPPRKQKNKASGWLEMAICGGAIVPMIHGWFADHIGLQHSFIILTFCYAYIACFGFYVYSKSKRKSINKLQSDKSLVTEVV